MQQCGGQLHCNTGHPVAAGGCKAGWSRSCCDLCIHNNKASHAASLAQPTCPQYVCLLHAVRGEDHSAAALHAINQVPQVPPAVECSTILLISQCQHCMEGSACIPPARRCEWQAMHTDAATAGGAWGARTVCTAPKPQAACLHHSCKAAHLEMGSSPVVGSSR